jgi:tetratricopeptide (TPR) repeat protein
MSFALKCENCGAPSGPSVGVCPYCKTPFRVEANQQSPTMKNIQKLFDEGDLAKALSLATFAEKEKPELLNNVAYVLIYAKILIEAEAPSSKIRAILQRAQMHHPENVEIAEYLEIIDAKNQLKLGREDAGEIELKNILRRSPNNAHAAFYLGSHLFWVEKDKNQGLVYLEKAIRARPNFLRALACLAAICQAMGSDARAAKLFQRCVELETEPGMKEFFQKMANGEKVR